MHWPVNDTQVYRAKKLDEIYLKTLAVRGVSVSIAKSVCFKSVIGHLQLGANSGSRSSWNQSAVAVHQSTVPEG